MTIDNLQSAKNVNDVATILGIKPKALIWYLYRCPDGKRYTNFSIKKKSGGERNILAPATYLKEVQRNLLHILDVAYKPPVCAHGYISKRSVLSNAKKHLESKFILNLDLKDFFCSINFGRVRGVFLNKPFLFNEKVATILAQICCHGNSLPQGAPTSSIVSNLVCRGMDKDLLLLAKKLGCRYTRYSDDITFSTTKQIFPLDLADIDVSSGKGIVVLGDALLAIIKGHNFDINESKTRLSGIRDRLEVTGITVNEKPNLNRRFIRQVRAMLHDWEKNSLAAASARHFREFNFKHRNPEKEQPLYRDIVRGKLNYLRFVKGPADSVYRSLRDRFERLDPKNSKIKDRVKFLYCTTWVIDSAEECMQGTTFWLKDFGLITCEHAVFGDSKVSQANDPEKLKFPIEILRSDKNKDIAVLRPAKDSSFGENYDQIEFEADFKHEIRPGDSITIAGFPQHEDGFGIHIAEGKVTQKCFDTKTWTPYWRVDCQIVAGNSGGPVLNKNNKVIGIVARGADAFEQNEHSQIYGVIPISELLNI